MVQMEERIRYLLELHIETKMTVIDNLSDSIAKAGQRLVQCLLNDGKILICGNGGSSANSMHFSSSMLHHFEVERPSLPVFHLSADAANLSSFANENHYAQVFARQIQALGQERDVLVLLTTSGNSDNILYALHAANEKGMDTIVLNGRDGGVLANHLGAEDIELRITSDNSARIRELHLFILHCFCDLIDQSLFGQVLG
jgi:D-sedoheptulose 7-phosphate isomerase